jgi:hypothetical protein
MHTFKLVIPFILRPFGPRDSWINLDVVYHKLHPGYLQSIGHVTFDTLKRNQNIWVMITTLFTEKKKPYNHSKALLQTKKMKENTFIN